MGNQIEQLWNNLLKPENEKIKIRSEKKSKIDKKINQLIQKKKKQSGGGMVDAAVMILLEGETPNRLTR